MKTLEEKVDSILTEAVYPGNIGFEEIVNFYQVATPQQKKEMEKIIEKGDFESFKKIIKKTIGVQLK